MNKIYYIWREEFPYSIEGRAWNMVDEFYKTYEEALENVENNRYHCIIMKLDLNTLKVEEV